MTNVLFICSQNFLRSPTAEAVFTARPDLEVRSAGTDDTAVRTVTEDDLLWSDWIFVMERQHCNKLQQRFKRAIQGRRILCLHIPDDYVRMDPELIRLLQVRVGRYLAVGREPAFRNPAGIDR